MKRQEDKELKQKDRQEAVEDVADILEEIEVEDLTVDGICGVY